MHATGITRRLVCLRHSLSTSSPSRQAKEITSGCIIHVTEQSTYITSSETLLTRSSLSHTFSLISSFPRRLITTFCRNSAHRFFPRTQGHSGKTNGAVNASTGKDPYSTTHYRTIRPALIHLRKTAVSNLRILRKHYTLLFLLSYWGDHFPTQRLLTYLAPHQALCRLRAATVSNGGNLCFVISVKMNGTRMSMV